MNNTTRSDSSHFNLHISGVGYLNRAREVPVQGRGRRGQPFLAVDIAALRGDNGYTRLDCRVSGHHAQETVRARMPDIQERKRVLVEFNVGDLYPDLFEYGVGPKAGQVGVSLKARLLWTGRVKVDDQAVHADPEQPLAQALRPGLKVRGVGYINRVHEIDGALFVTVAALHGSADDVQYTYFDMAVVGHEARDVIRRLAADAKAKKKVLIGFRAEDLGAETFVYQRGGKAGQTGVSLKTNLVMIGWAKVDGESVYTAPKPEAGTMRGEVLVKEAA